MFRSRVKVRKHTTEARRRATNAQQQAREEKGVASLPDTSQWQQGSDAARYGTGEASKLSSQALTDSFPV